ncbi:hypothetical protein E2C01_056169 [Portunus trituberculatus]|uniref:Uncharacterized protein n=1 Tax=Portunus trituberculatus TaxID=210409 RepID=A0A5B7GYW5_PORTR|nr:hypothetical protein [Portunus trituberculatus]
MRIAVIHSGSHSPGCSSSLSGLAPCDLPLGFRVAGPQERPLMCGEGERPTGCGGGGLKGVLVMAAAGGGCAAAVSSLWAAAARGGREGAPASSARDQQPSL